MSTVTIGCKLPAGVIMQVGEKRVRINGWNQNTIQGASHGVTTDVPADLWEAWKKEHADSKLVKDGFIFASESTDTVEAKAKDKKEQKSGHEQLPKIKASDKPGTLGASDA